MNHLLRKQAEELLSNELNKLLPSQISFFHRIYGEIKDIPDSKIDWAVEQCERTLEKNIRLNRIEETSPLTNPTAGKETP